MQRTTQRVVHLLLCSEDREFVQAIAYYVHTHPEWCRKLKLTTFTATEQLERYISGHPLWDVCMCTQRFLPVMEKLDSHQDCILLVEEKERAKAEVQAASQIGSIRSLYAYQPVPQLLEEVERHVQLVDLCTQRGQSQGSHAGNGRIIAVCSAAGGTGKTTLSLTLAKLWSRSRRVVYLNMEDVLTFPPQGKDDPLAEWLYLVRSRENNRTEAGMGLAEEALARAITRMHEAPVDWIKPLRHAEDFEELGEKEFLQLRHMLFDHFQYEIVVADLPSAWNKHIHSVLEHSDSVICLVDGSTGCREKTAHLLERMQARYGRRPEKAWLFVNGKSMDLQTIQEPDERLSYRVHDALPYVPAWKCNKSRFLQDHPVYTQAVLRLVESLEERMSGSLYVPLSTGQPEERNALDLVETRTGKSC